MIINIHEIDHSEQRYPTVGDWWIGADGVLQVRVSKMSDPRYSALVAIHEIVEVLIEGTKCAGKLEVPRELVDETDKFDKVYEAARDSENEAGEPGCEPDCPVYQGHMAASAIE